MSTRKNESRPNAKRPGGPKNTTSTRFNAVKHAFLAAGLTELDDVDAYRSTLRGLKEKYSEELENFLLERLALHMTRLRRCAGWEAHEITAILNPPFYGEDPFAVPSLETVIDPGLPALADAERFGPLVSIFQRYETSIENKLIRSMHELERLRRIKQGEGLPAPIALDVTVNSDSNGVDSFAEQSDKTVGQGCLSQPVDKEELSSEASSEVGEPTDPTAKG
jgi:hypothetical protein